MLLFSLAGIPPLAGFFAKYLRVPCRDQGRALWARRDRRARQRGRRLLLSAHRQDHVFRRAGEEPFEPMPGSLKAVLGIAGLFNILFFVYPAPLITAASSCGEVVVLDELDPRLRQPGTRLITHGTLGSTNAEALHAGAAGERGPLWITAATPDRRPRPARPRLGVGAGQSLCEPAADRSGVAGFVCRNCRSSRRWRCTMRSLRGARGCARC